MVMVPVMPVMMIMLMRRRATKAGQRDAIWTLTTMGYPNRRLAAVGAHVRVVVHRRHQFPQAGAQDDEDHHAGRLG
jgi:hypothetical protein